MAGEIRVIGAGATRRAMEDAGEAFGRREGCRVATAYTHGHAVRDAIAAGRERADVVSLPAEMIAELAAGGRVVAGSEAALGDIAVAAAVRDGAPRPDISSAAALVEAVRAAQSVVITAQGSGRHVASVFARLGIAGEVADRVTTYDTGAEVNAHIAAGGTDPEIGFGLTTEIFAHRGKGVSLLGILPDGLANPAPYQAALLAGSAEEALARRFLAYLTTPEAAGFLAASGVVAAASR